MNFFSGSFFQGFKSALIAVLFVAGQSTGGAKTPSIAPEFINFGYVQNNAILDHVQFESFTHIAPPFVDFLADGTLHSGTRNSFGNRPATLRAGGAAQRAGTKVIVCVRNRNFDEPLLATVMQSATLRTRLVNQVRDMVLADSYCAGVNFDFEFRWNSTTRDGITVFMNEMRDALPDHEISVYVHATYNPTLWDIPAIIDTVDYVLYSTYDWASGNRVGAITNYQAVLGQLAYYFNDGVPPEKMVLTWGTYGRRWYSKDDPLDYGDSGEGRQSQGFYDTLFNTTLRQSDGGPFAPTYRRGAEVVSYTYTQPDPVTGQTVYFGSTGESVESLEMKISAARVFPGYQGQWKGVKLRGVGWWSMMWVAPYWSNFNLDAGSAFFSGFDPIANTVVKRSPYYRHVDLLVQEILKKPGQTKFNLESFENVSSHWSDPDVSPDSTTPANGLSAFGGAPAPSGPGRPEGTTQAGRLSFDFTGSGPHRLFLRYEMLNHGIDQGVIDTPSALALVSKNTRISGYYYVSGDYSARTLRLAALDGLRQVEVSNPITLPATTGWYQFTWDLNDDSQVNGYTTAEPNFGSGNGTIDVSAPGAREVSFLGFVLEGGAEGRGNIYFDELTYEKRAPEGREYVINEFRYGQNSTEFVEIAGPPGEIPTGLELVAYDSSDGSVYKSVSLNGRRMPPGGLLVVGDGGVPQASGATGFIPPNWSNSSADLPGNLPGGLQLYDNNSGYVYDSVVYGAFGGVGELSRIQTRRVTAEGYGWMGSLGNGTDGNGNRYSMGRMPDGVDTDQNQRDFSFMPATPGSPNGAPGLIDVQDAWDFETVPPGAFQTYREMRLELPQSAGVPASPSGGRAYRAVDTSGGGMIGVFGDAEQGGNRGLDITGELYIPGLLDPDQAVAVGFCGTMGSTFFTPNPVGSGYEDGYWLIYTNGDPNINLGQPKRPGSFQFLLASHDNLDNEPTRFLGFATPGIDIPVLPGTWATFRLRLDLEAEAGEQLVAQIGGYDVYRGPVPDDGPTKGAFMVGFRERGDGVLAREGTWIDNLRIDYARPPARVVDYELY